ncbi:cardiolipin synthase [Nocardioides limicola]|uniref:cardiolipin synthase n=1 Tax=Nocardioides limicola TaxID=2803368 RepID=UPI00193B3F86|nr:cardiolipin synthase [Nocardioides sp. DJM-14]
MSDPSWPVLLGAAIVFAEISLRLIALGVIPGNRKPSTGMAWLLLILVQPILGFLFFSMFGRTALGRRRHERQRRAHRAIAEARAEHSGVLPAIPDQVATVIHLNRTLGAMPAVAGNTVDLLADYRQTLAAMTRAVEAAERYVHVEFYIAAWDEETDPFFRALVAATERGVTVRLLFDHLGSRRLGGYRQMLRRLRGTEIQWRRMLPIQPLRGRWRRPDLRNHRKLVVVDGAVGFTGSLNLTEPGYHNPRNHRLGREWVELMVRLQGPLVADLDAVFAADWYTETAQVTELTEPPPATTAGTVGQIVPSGPGFASENNLRMFTSLIYSATRRVSLTSPYFVPDESLLYAVTTAAQRGVDVELFVSEVSDQFMVGHAQASYYQALLEAGVRIHRYPAPYILHSKHFTIDDDVAVVGTSNMDLRSFALNYEISVMLLGVDVVARMREVEDRYRELSTELFLPDWRRRPARTKYVDNVMRLTAALQ